MVGEPSGWGASVWGYQRLCITCTRMSEGASVPLRHFDISEIGNRAPSGRLECCPNIKHAGVVHLDGYSYCETSEHRPLLWFGIGHQWLGAQPPALGQEPGWSCLWLSPAADPKLANWAWDSLHDTSCSPALSGALGQGAVSADG